MGKIEVLEAERKILQESYIKSKKILSDQFIELIIEYRNKETKINKKYINDITSINNQILNAKIQYHTKQLNKNVNNKSRNPIFKYKNTNNNNINHNNSNNNEPSNVHKKYIINIERVSNNNNEMLSTPILKESVSDGLMVDDIKIKSKNRNNNAGNSTPVSIEFMYADIDNDCDNENNTDSDHDTLLTDIKIDDNNRYQYVSHNNVNKNNIPYYYKISNNNDNNNSNNNNSKHRSSDTLCDCSDNYNNSLNDIDQCSEKEPSLTPLLFNQIQLNDNNHNSNNNSNNNSIMYPLTTNYHNIPIHPDLKKQKSMSDLSGNILDL